MKYLILVISLIAVSQAAPAVDVYKDAGDSAFNATRDMSRAVGWGGMNGGVQGGNGGATWTVWDAWALRDALNSHERREVVVRGRIDLTPLFVSSPGVRLPVGSFTSVRGGDGNAMITGGGLQISNVHQVIIWNLRIHNALSYYTGESPNGNGFISNLRPHDYSEIDGVEVSGSTHVWIDHCEFSDSPWNANASPRRHDGHVDIVRGSDLVTVSNCMFMNHIFTSLVGNGDGMGATDNGRLRVTYFANWFRGVDQRCPRVRFGRVHVLNNLYTDVTSYGIGVGFQAQIFAERNVFINTRRAWGWASGQTDGRLEANTNLLHNSGFDSGIPANPGWNPWGTYNYQAIPIGNVEAHVRTYAGII